MNSLSEVYCFNSCISDRNLFELDSSFHILPQLLILFYLLISKHGIMSYLLLTILFVDFFNDFVLVLFLSLILQVTSFRLFLFLQHGEGKLLLFVP